MNLTPHGKIWRQPCNTWNSTWYYLIELLVLVRLPVYYQIKYHAPPAVSTPAWSVEFQPCGYTILVAYFHVSLPSQVKSKFSLSDLQIISDRNLNTLYRNLLITTKSDLKIATSSILVKPFMVNHYSTHKSGMHRLQDRLLGSLIQFAPYPFVPQCQ